jgi:hypothetical protein
MRVTIAGYLTDYKGRVLLQQPEPSRLTPVTVSLAPGALPAETLAAAFRAATGLVVWPVRLVGVYFVARDGGELTLSYRCTLRGGELQPPDGQPPAGYVDPKPLPRGLSAAQRRQLDDALRHAGGPAITARPSGGLLDNLRRPKGGQAGGALDWAVTARLIVASDHDQVAWTRGAATELWRLPAAVVGPGEAPWAAAERLRRTLRLDQNGTRGVPRLITVDADRPILTVVFVANLYEPPFPHGLGETLGFAAPHRADETFDAADRALAAEVLAGPDQTIVQLAQ